MYMNEEILQENIKFYTLILTMNLFRKLSIYYLYGIMTSSNISEMLQVTI